MKDWIKFLVIILGLMQVWLGSDAGSELVVNSPDTDITQAQTTLQVAGGTPLSATALDTFRGMVTSEDVLGSTIEALELDSTPATLAGQIALTAVPDQGQITITVTTREPELAVPLAAELARQIILRMPSALTPEQQAQLTATIEQLNALSGELAHVQAMLHEIDADLASTEDPDQIDQLTQRRQTLEAQTQGLMATLDSLQTIVTALQARGGVVTVAVPAHVVE